MPLTLSFTPGEIVTPGTVLTVASDGVVDTQSSLQLVSSGREIAIPLSENTFKISTENLMPGTHRVRGSVIYSTQTDPTNDSVDVAFLVSPMKGRVPGDLRVEHVVHLAIGDTNSIRLKPGDEAPTGMQYIELVKASDRESNVSIPLAFDLGGNQIDGQETLNALNWRRIAKFGFIDEALFKMLEKAGENELIKVIIWPTMEEKPPLDGTEIGALRASEPRQYQQPKITSALRSFNATFADPAEIPPVSAVLTRSQIRQISDSDDVAMVFLDDEGGVLDAGLGDSLGIHRVPPVHALGIKGSGVKVAVFENGPKTLTNLSFAGRFLTSPTSDPGEDGHARHTCGIIKNLLTPFGFAPSCQLYSANSYLNTALTWAVTQMGCTVISQSFHRDSEQTSGTLSADDVLKDWMATHPPFPTVSSYCILI